jgi:4-amino-4-deoxychorismate lyase
LAPQPVLAGLKHLNRLEQVLAKRECVDAGADDGLMCSVDGRVIATTSANLFVWRMARWQTPRVIDCGIRGICRAQLIELLGADESDLTVWAVEDAEALFLCNSVRGIIEVAALGERRFIAHPAIAQARRQLGALEPAFAIAQGRM